MRRAALLTAPLLALAPFTPGCSYAIGHANGGFATLEEGRAPVRQVAIGAKYLGWLASAPLLVGLFPLAALSWATPWVDLPTAVDIATAPSLALGYACQALVAGPLHAALAWADDRGGEPPVRPPLTPPSLPLTPWGLVVDHRPQADPPRPAAPLPDVVAARYALPPGVTERLARALDVEVEAQRAPRVARLEHFAGCLEWYPACDAGAQGATLVLMTPPTQATFAARYMARRFAERGVHAAVLVPDEEFLDPDLDAAGIEAMLRGAVVDARAAVGALLARPEVERVVFLGVSAGGVFGTLLLAVEPRVERAALVLPGGDFPELVATSTETTVRAYREAWGARGVDPDALAASFAREVVSDPLLLARHVDPRRVLLFLGAWDDLVPISGGLRLREALGRPETYLLAGNHETATLCFGFLLREAEDFLLARPR